MVQNESINITILGMILNYFSQLIKTISDDIRIEKTNVWHLLKQQKSKPHNINFLQELGEVVPIGG